MLDGDMFTRIVNNPMAQFGPKNRRYLGATLLPEENKLNAYKETYIQYRSNVANAGTRYSPPQMKGNALTGSMFVELAESDIAAEFSSQDYDTIMDLIKALPDNTALGEVPPQAMTLMFRWAEQMLLTPLLEFNEMCRWQAIVSAQVQLRGDNGFAENVVYSNPAGHRVNAGGQWSNSSYDPYADIQAGVQKLQDKGYNVSRMIGGLPVVQMLLRNAKIQQRMGMISIASGGVTGMPMNVTLQKLNNLLAEDGLPVIEQYDLQYRTQTSTSYFLARNVFVMEAIRVNIFGTRILADLSVKHKVETFVMISTDKAVKPTNVMGASKRFAEMYCQAMANENGKTTHFITTRFGNVLGSNGSVIKIFRKQIESGGPVSVTHPDITRFFMTIPEACQLVIEASVMGENSEIFIFDMGEPVKILDLAKKMIILAGYEPDKDIMIVFTGLRPGEKLYEELLDSGSEDVVQTYHPKIMIGKVSWNTSESMLVFLRELQDALTTGDHRKMVSVLKKAIPEYISKNSVYESLDVLQLEAVTSPG